MPLRVVMIFYVFGYFWDVFSQSGGQNVRQFSVVELYIQSVYILFNF